MYLNHRHTIERKKDKNSDIEDQTVILIEAYQHLHYRKKKRGSHKHELPSQHDEVVGTLTHVVVMIPMAAQTAANKK